jgi:HAMP domain-containing protein
VTDTTEGSRRFALSLGTRIFLVTSLLIALAVGASVAFTWIVIQGIARKSVHESLRNSASAQEALQEQRYEQLKLSSRLVAVDPALTAYIAEATKKNELRSILDLLDSRREELGYNFAIVLDSAGRVIARNDNPAATGENLAQRPLVAKAIANLDASGVWREGDNLFYAVAVPIGQQFDLFGYMVTGFRIDDAAARQINAVSGSDVAFLVVDREPKVLATTLSPAMRDGLAAALRARRQLVMQAVGSGGRGGQEIELALDGEPWTALLSPLRDAAGHPVGATVSLASLARELAGYRRIEAVLLLAGLASILLGPLLSLVFARRTLAPVRRLVASAEAARQGNFDQKIAVDSGDEVGRLARAFDDLLAELREKRDMELYVTELSRNLPEPAPARIVLGTPQSRQALLLGIELRAYAHTRDAPPQQVLERLAREVQHIASAVGAAGGQLQAVLGHRLLARFEGPQRARGALAAAAQVLQPQTLWKEDPEAEAPCLAMASGVVATGPVTWGEQTENALVGQPVQQIESLLREGTGGDLVMSREVYEELKQVFAGSGYQLAPRRGLVTPQPLYILSAEIAGRLAGKQETLSSAASEEDASALWTLSGISPGAIMGHRFQVLSVLGAGGMGVVYKARDRELDDLVALKMLKRDLWGDASQLERLKSELKLARKITHPNVLRTHDFGDIEGVPYISMEYVRGVTLRYLLDQAHRLPYSAGLRLAKQLCAGLGAAHAVGVIHRDIKPENLILEPTGNAKLMDFGIARPITRLEPSATQAGFVVGTPQYLAPEQLQGAEASPRSDIYSCGIVFYEVFTGVLPFVAGSAMDVMLKHLKEEPAPPSRHWPEIPPRLEGIILRCLRKDPAERYASVDELLRDLESLSA